MYSTFLYPSLHLTSLHVYPALDYKMFEHRHQAGKSLYRYAQAKCLTHCVYSNICCTKKNLEDSLCGCQKQNTNLWIYQFGLSHSHLQKEKNSVKISLDAKAEWISCSICEEKDVDMDHEIVFTKQLGIKIRHLDLMFYYHVMKWFGKQVPKPQEKVPKTIWETSHQKVWH